MTWKNLQQDIIEELEHTKHVRMYEAWTYHLCLQKEWNQHRYNPSYARIKYLTKYSSILKERYSIWRASIPRLRAPKGSVPPKGTPQYREYRKSWDTRYKEKKLCLGITSEKTS